MTQFFRRIRQNLLSENKFKRYLLYALGEIVLVVVGILIALAINNGNQRRINKKNEQLYLFGLKEEFSTSQVKLKELMRVNQANLKGASKILTFTSGKNGIPSELEFSKLLYNTFSNDISFNPNNSLLIEIINSGSLKNISDSKLRILLTNWISTLEDISKQERDLAVQRGAVLDMFRTEENSLRTIFQSTEVYKKLHLPEAAYEISNLNLLESVKFENNILMFISATHATEEAHYKPLLVELEVILQLIEKELSE